ncbi:ATP-binding cassette domain-containing protein [Bifidobacterium bifidum]|uniref:ATP-binding cassette domain-containing protein n=1 Tax=Bifidobacterium bifidum TaxID=1681 RepID=UPI000E512028|nr:ATP-binding cassette domain-containing protein [Bifidobacterium bifidum]RHH18839.1 ATP-binding cassette domain-containing protein [Bifidobacterium bifidum]RHH30067.1 ATP-binding cassette domain-containing protein [Bifidobacterium bifidum]RHH31154.1 ATP-binding cassette domain-containing protein [Bifidobacterium bifidum]RHH36170.1 ATP-binding cassette domain-containing protein [Bifidobacterium bifidum]
MLDNASFTAEDGKVTGFLGSNGAGKSTTMRAALGLVTPNAGRALVDGVPFVKTPSPMTVVGAVLAGQGRAVLLSSRLMSEVALTADDLVIIGRGRILDTTTVAAFVAGHSTHSIRVATPEPDKLHAVFETAPQVTVREVPRNANDPQQGRVFRIEGAALEPTARALTHAQVQYETRAMPGQVPAQYGEPAATYTQPNTQEVPR